MADRQLWGDCHTHSDYSDGLFGIAEQTPFFEAFGDDFRFQTDHYIIELPEARPWQKWLRSEQWQQYCEDCQSGTTGRHLCSPGVELGWQIDAARTESEGWFHTKLYPPPGTPIPGEAFFGGRTYLEMLRAAKDAGHGVVIAHIDQGAPLERLTGGEIHGLEVRGDIEETRPLFTRPSLAEWDRMLVNGHRVCLSSGSDAHQPDQWAGSGLRTVVVNTVRDPGAIVNSVLAGRSYLSRTWHPDCFEAAGWPTRENPVVGGKTHFIPWWEFKAHPQLRDREPRELIAEVFERSLGHGRCRREDYPTLLAFTVQGAGSGEETGESQRAEVEVRWATHIPVSGGRLIADAEVVFALPSSHSQFGRTEGHLTTAVDLRGKHYVRLEIDAADPHDPSKQESLLANPIYIRA